MKAQVDEEAVQRLLNQPTMERHFIKIGEQIRLFAVAMAPKRTLHYVRSIGVELRRKPLRVYVTAKDFKAHWIEWGAGPSPYRGWRPFIARHTLERATNAVGLRVRAAKRGEL